jgi:subtilisin family serine protease
LNKNLGIFYVASLSILLLASTVAIPLQSFAEKPDNAKTPVVILFNDKVSQNDRDLIKSNGGEITRTYKIINGLAANIPPQSIEKLQNNPSVVTVDPDIEFHALELDADNRIGANQVWSHTTPATGNGVRVAVLDTGIDTDNQEFVGRIMFCESEMGPAEPTCEDLHGHGTHAAGIAGASGVNNIDLAENLRRIGKNSLKSELRTKLKELRKKMGE